MRRLFLFILLSLLSGQALAHRGHIATEAGHSHWLALAALAAATFAVVAIGASLVRRRLKHG